MTIKIWHVILTVGNFIIIYRQTGNRYIPTPYIFGQKPKKQFSDDNYQCPKFASLVLVCIPSFIYVD